jgi:hypothetical protein
MSFCVAAALVVWILGRAVVSAAPPEPMPAEPVAEPTPDDRPACDELRITGAQMSAAFQARAKKAGQAPEGRAAFDAIGDELGCRWPWSAEESRRGLMRLLEQSGGRRVQ